MISLFHTFSIVRGDIRREACCTALIDKLDLFFGYTAQFDNVATCTLADSHYAVCFAERLEEFFTIYLNVNPVVVFRMAHEDKIMDGHYRLDACFANAYRKLARQSMEHLYTVGFQLSYDAS